MKHFLLTYEAGSDYAARRAPWRTEHIRLALAARQRGELVLAGGLAEPVDGSVFLFQGESPAVAEAFARVDPYVREGLVSRWRVREWTTVLGDLALNPLPPTP